MKNDTLTEDSRNDILNFMIELHQNLNTNIVKIKNK
jgi:hypothetical protein